MSARYPGHNPNPFASAELGGMDLPADEIAADARIARELEGVADRGTVKPSADFADRVMASIANEPTPAPAVAAGSAVKRLSLVALVASVRDAVRITFGHGFPAAARAQALAVVLVALVAVGGVTAGAAGALGAFNTDDHSPAPTTLPTPLVTTSPSPSAEPTPTEEQPSDSLAPSDSPSVEPSESEDPTESPEPSRSPEPTETAQPHNSGGNSGSSGSNPTPRPTKTPRPTPTPTPTPSHEHHDGGESPKPTHSPEH